MSSTGARLASSTLKTSMNPAAHSHQVSGKVAQHQVNHFQHQPAQDGPDQHAFELVADPAAQGLIRLPEAVRQDKF